METDKGDIKLGPYGFALLLLGVCLGTAVLSWLILRLIALVYWLWAR